MACITTLEASQIVAGGQSEAVTPGSKNAIAQSILKGCQIASYQIHQIEFDILPHEQLIQQMDMIVVTADHFLDVYRSYNRSEVVFSGIPPGCVFQGDSVPGVSASLQPPATFWDRFAIKVIGHLEKLVPAAGDDLNLAISATNIVTSVEWHHRNNHNRTHFSWASPVIYCERSLQLPLQPFIRFQAFGFWKVVRGIGSDELQLRFRIEQ